MDNNPYAPPKANLDEPASAGTPAAAPPLWNPAAAARWSLLFSPIFGALLHLKNWRALGEPQKAAESRMWLIVSAAVFVFSVLSILIWPDSKALDSLSPVIQLGLFVAWYFGSARSQYAYVAQRFGTDYPRKPWGLALLLAVLAYAAVYVVIVLALLVMFPDAEP